MGTKSRTSVNQDHTGHSRLNGHWSPWARSLSLDPLAVILLARSLTGREMLRPELRRMRQQKTMARTEMGTVKASTNPRKAMAGHFHRLHH